MVERPDETRTSILNGFGRLFMLVSILIATIQPSRAPPGALHGDLCPYYVGEQHPSPAFLGRNVRTNDYP